MYTINPKLSTKITEERFIGNKPTHEIKLNHKMYSINPREDRKYCKENKELVRQLINTNV